ncbi:MAG: hypothetical protein ACOVNL_11855 [Prochlorococcaceae cyanobacterium]|jgi:hypothetical protein
MDFTQDFAHPQEIAAVIGLTWLGLGLSLELIALRMILRDRHDAPAVSDTAPARGRRPRLA